jgi:hypothetical protein
MAASTAPTKPIRFNVQPPFLSKPQDSATNPASSSPTAYHLPRNSSSRKAGLHRIQKHVHLSSRKPPEPRNGGNVSPFILPRQLRARFVCASLEPRLVCPRGPYPENQAVRPSSDSCPFQGLVSGLHGVGVLCRLGKGTAAIGVPGLHLLPIPVPASFPSDPLRFPTSPHRWRRRG